DWPHRRTDERASKAWTRWATVVSRRRWVAAAGGMAVVLALVGAAGSLQLGTSDADTLAPSGEAHDGLVALARPVIGEGSLLPHEILVDRSADPQALAGELDGIDGV